MEEAAELKWIGRLKRLKDDRRIKTYGELASLLGMSKQSMTNVISGRQELPLNAKLSALLLLNEEVTQDDYVGLLPAKTRITVGDEASRVFDPVDGEELKKGFWVSCIDKLGKQVKARSDSELAQGLKIGQSMISQERAGRGGLSSIAKIRILDKLGYTAARSLLLDLLPPKTAKRLKELDNLRFKKRGRKVVKQ